MEDGCQHTGLVRLRQGDGWRGGIILSGTIDVCTSPECQEEIIKRSGDVVLGHDGASYRLDPDGHEYPIPHGWELD